jgi:hypothetical protein
MSSGTGSTVKANRTVVWAGRILVILGIAHLVITGWVSRTHIGGWLAGSAWPAPGGLADMSPAVGAFWLTLGSFGLPQTLLGGLVARLGKAGGTAPGYVGWGLAVWGVVCAAAFEPSPFATVLVPAIMLLSARRRANLGRVARAGGAGTRPVDVAS